MYRKYYFLVLPAIAFWLLSCGSGSTKSGNPTDTAAKSDSVVSINYDRKFNDYSRFLAGMPSAAGSVLGTDDSSAAYEAWLKEFNMRWEEVDKNRLSKMRDFAKKELHTHIDANKNLLYPFSGADFLHAHQFFPSSKKNLYIANETVGIIPNLGSMNKAKRTEYLKQVEAALRNIFEHSYFITKNMMKDIPTVKGVIPVYMVFLARTGNEVLNIELIDMVEGGKIVPRTGKATGVEGVRFTYRPNDNPKDIRVLEYFNCNAADDGMKRRPQVIAYIKAFGKCNVFFKAASYLMHQTFFSEIRSATLEVADGIVQDDTGIPFRFLKNDYNYFLYGKYVRPVKDFGKGGYQEDLEKEYAKGTNVKPLPFSLGYHWYDKQQNYMCFRKK
jgi:hypothetical protein